jgi:hypothetical protein
MINSRFRLGRRKRRRSHRASSRVASVSRQVPFTVAELLDMLGEFGPGHLPEPALVDNLCELGPEYLLKSLAVPPPRDIIWEIVGDAEKSGRGRHDPDGRLLSGESFPEAVPRQATGANGAIRVRSQALRWGHP